LKVALTVNGQAVEVEVRPDEMLLGVLRRELDLTSVRQTCGVGVCGACTALLDGEPISTCILLAPLAKGREITTVEGLSGSHPVQEAFVEAQAFQCGYCTPGMILTAKRLLEEDPNPSDEKIKTYLGGNLCRCGCYAKIEDAVHLAAGSSVSGAAGSRGPGRETSRGGM
jgi:aerobic-type carbon monoxide dehydrogenase small subunit (CoxS/CutS family)